MADGDSGAKPPDDDEDDEPLRWRTQVELADRVDRAPIDIPREVLFAGASIAAGKALNPEDKVPMAVHVKRTDVLTPGEALHVWRTRWSQAQLFPTVAATVGICAWSFTTAVPAIRAMLQVRRFPSQIEHVLGFQFVWNTQPLDTFFQTYTVGYITAAVVLYLVCNVLVAAFKLLRWVLRGRDVGWGTRNRRDVTMWWLRAARTLTWVVVVALTIGWRTVTFLPVTEAFFSATCELTPALGRDAATTMALEGTLLGACTAYFDQSILSNERAYRGEIPDVNGITRMPGSNVTVFMQPVGAELGCATGQPLFPSLPTGTGNSSLTAVWTPFADRPLRRCLSSKGYLFSNWYTGAANCSADVYARWLNKTMVAYASHAEQWYCNRNSSLSTAAVGIEYDTAGWVSTVTGDTCLSTNESSPSAAFGPFVEPLLRGLRDVAWYDASPLAQGSFVTTMPLADGNVSQWLTNVSSLLAPWPPDACETVSVACIRASPWRKTFYRALAFHGCHRSIPRVGDTALLQSTQAAVVADWTAASPWLSIQGAIDIGVDVLEVAVSSLFF